MHFCKNIFFIHDGFGFLSTRKNKSGGNIEKFGLGKTRKQFQEINVFLFKFLDEKKQYDPTGFRDAILEGLEASGDDLEAVIKFLVSN